MGRGLALGEVVRFQLKRRVHDLEPFLETRSELGEDVRTKVPTERIVPHANVG